MNLASGTARHCWPHLLYLTAGLPMARGLKCFRGAMQTVRDNEVVCQAYNSI